MVIVIYSKYMQLVFVGKLYIRWTVKCKIDEKSSGPDNILGVFLKKCANNLVVPLEYIFNYSLKSGTLPNKWKPSYIIPLFKTESRNNIENYRSIAILSTFGNLFESLVTTFLTYQTSNFISSKQQGSFYMY